MIIVIPCYNEPDLISTLQSLEKCQKPDFSTEVIVVINASEKAPEIVKMNNITSFKVAKQWSENRREAQLAFHFILENQLPDKRAGVGLARKIGMDEAARRLPLDGVIICFDADTTCREDYLIELATLFGDPSVSSASIHFEHPIRGNTFHQEVYKAIVQYELHLRYFIDCQKAINLPYAYQTVGSAMAVRNQIYQKVGGMNVRKAGEDFYFIHKCIKIGGFRECKTTEVYPSPRISSRVPFGTGKAVNSLIKSDEITYFTYHPESFHIIKSFVENLDDFYLGKLPIPPQLKDFLDIVKFPKKINEIGKNTASLSSFRKQFYHWFDAFLLMKALHFLRGKGYPDMPVIRACKLKYPQLSDNPVEILEWFRARSLVMDY